MPQSSKIDVYVETGNARTFASAIDWPGWSRSGSDEQSALAALLAQAPRYGKAMKAAKIDFTAPEDTSAFHVVARLEGSGNTDFGVPALPAPGDDAKLAGEELERLRAILLASWKAFDKAVQDARGKELRKGPRGGGRDLDRVISHVLDADGGYLTALGGKSSKSDPGGDLIHQLETRRRVMLETLEASARGEIPAHGPRGGVRWTPRYFVRRAAWHALDHAWEIEDRAI